MLALVAAVVGCGGGITEQGTLYSVNPSRGVTTYMAGDLQTVHEAAILAVEQDLRYTVKEQASDAREGIVKARTARDRMVRVSTFKYGDRVTKIEVYVSGDRTSTLLLLNRIEARVQ